MLQRSVTHHFVHFELVLKHNQKWGSYHPGRLSPEDALVFFSFFYSLLHRKTMQCVTVLANAAPISGIPAMTTSLNLTSQRDRKCHFSTVSSALLDTSENFVQPLCRQSCGISQAFR